MIDIYIDGLDELNHKLGEAATTHILRRPMNQSVIHLEGQMKVYPPQRSGSSYRRTGTLGRRWTHSISESPNEIRGTVGNNTAYGPFVQSRQFQVRVHQGRWQTDEQVIEDEQLTIEDFFRFAVNEALE